MKLATALLAVLAAGLLTAGMVMGFAVPVSSPDGYDCGSAFHESDDLGSAEMLDTMQGGTGASGCDHARSSAKPLPVVLLVIGAVAGFAAAFLAPVGAALPSTRSGRPAAMP